MGKVRRQMMRDAKRRWRNLILDMSLVAHDFNDAIMDIEDVELRNTILFTVAALSAPDRPARFVVHVRDLEVDFDDIQMDEDLYDAMLTRFGAEKMDAAVEWVVSFGSKAKWSLIFILWGFGNIELAEDDPLAKEENTYGVSEGIVFSFTDSKIVGLPIDPEGDFFDPNNLMPVPANF